MMAKWNWRKYRIIFPRENEHLADKDFSFATDKNKRNKRNYVTLSVEHNQ